MKLKLFLLIIVSAFCMNINVKADEGMWLPLLINRLNYVDMQKMGCHLTADEIYSVNNASIKDAIVVLNNGMCSAVMVSAEGLLLTNHHCGLSFTQSHSSVESDYLTNGFWAMSKMEELRNDKLTASFLIRIEDVTGKILSGVNDKMTENSRQKIIDSLSIILAKEATKGTVYTAKVLPFFDGNEYYMFVTEVFKDVRLVGTPPEALGEYGGDADNWNWPRDDCDFSIFRVYMSPSGDPAEYSKKNVPFHPKKFLPISLKGVKKDDFTMVLGYPGTSDRFITSYGVKVALEEFNPPFIKTRGKTLSIMTEAMNSSPEIHIKYASKYEDLSNYYKYYVGQSEQLEKLKVYDKKVAVENEFRAWYNSDPQRKEMYGNVLSEIEKAYQDVGKYTTPFQYSAEMIVRRTSEIQILSYAHTFVPLYDQLKLPTDEEAINKLTQSLTYTAKIYFKDYDLATDKKICTAMLQMFFTDVPAEFHPDFFQNIQKKYKGSIPAFIEDMYANSIFASKDKILDFLTKPDYKKLDKDVGYLAMLSFFNKNKEIIDLYNNSLLELRKGTRLFVKGIMEMNKDKKYYPNANSTMRLTYGKVTDYTPPGKPSFTYYSTLDQMMAREKADPKNPDFATPPKLKQIFEKKDYGKYSTDGEMRLCFITNNDVTGGDSGAPVINADGELVGLNFDITWEATSDPICFDEKYQRSITVDVKYILLIIDKYAGASNIINELTLKE